MFTTSWSEIPNSAASYSQLCRTLSPTKCENKLNDIIVTGVLYSHNVGDENLYQPPDLHYQYPGECKKMLFLFSLADKTVEKPAQIFCGWCCAAVAAAGSRNFQIVFH